MVFGEGGLSLSYRGAGGNTEMSPPPPPPEDRVGVAVGRHLLSRQPHVLLGGSPGQWLRALPLHPEGLEVPGGLTLCDHERKTVPPTLSLSFCVRKMEMILRPISLSGFKDSVRQGL